MQCTFSNNREAYENAKSPNPKFQEPLSMRNSSTKRLFILCICIAAAAVFLDAVGERAWDQIGRAETAIENIGSR